MHDAIERCHDAVAVRPLFSLRSWQDNDTILEFRKIFYLQADQALLSNIQQILA